MEAAMVLVVAIACAALGYIGGKEAAANDCKKLGAFEASRTVYECKERKQ